MSLSSISEMRALLAAQPEAPAKPVSLSGVVRTLFTPKTDGGLQRVELGPPVAAPVEILDAAPPPPPGRAFIPPELLLGAFGPRRSEFGQRAQVAPRHASRLVSGEEMRPRERIEEFGRSPEDFSVRAIAASEAETPFFPGDLLDEDRPFVLSSFGRIDGPPDAGPPAPRVSEPAEAPRENPELRQTFLLASLAAKLAAEGAFVAGRLAAVGAAVFEPVPAAA